MTENKEDTTFESEQDRIEFLRSRGVELDLVKHKDETIIDKTSDSTKEDDGFLTDEQRQEWKRAQQQEDDDDLQNMTLEQRQQWLRDRGVLIEDPQDRARGATPQPVVGETKKVAYVSIPWDTSKPLQQCFAQVPVPKTSSNLPSQQNGLQTWLKPLFASPGQVDVDLLMGQAQTDQLLSSTDTNVSNQTLQQVAQEGHVESFTLVHPTSSNKHKQIQLYLDEVGMLKRLPLNPRAAALAKMCGFDPPPKFYGNVYVGRLAHLPRVENVDFVLGQDLPPDLGSNTSLPEWLKRAAMENLNHQLEMNKMQGIDTSEAAKRHLQQVAVGEDGVAKEEDQYSWTQTDDELELVVPLPSGTTSKQIQVSFRPKQVILKVNQQPLLSIDLFAAIDVDGCTWTLDKPNLVMSCEKAEGGVSWPRISS